MQDVKVSNSGGIILLGKQGENLARKIQFDISRWISTFGPGTVQLLHQRSGDEAPYPVAVEQDGTLAIWKVSSADTASAGTGRTELQYYVGDTLAKSETWMTKVLPALGDASETPPEAQQGWVDQVLQAGAAAVEAADRAENAAVRQPIVGDNGNWWTWDLDAVAYIDTGIYSGGDAPYIGANGNWYVGQTDTGVAATGPTGPVGPQGPEGPVGPVGPEGPEGPVGPVGPEGPEGPAGTTGPAGPHGPQGEPGPQGPEGPTGPTGATGPQGPKGDKGDQGEKGDTGAQGPKGDKGDTGERGPIGETGAQGPAGPALAVTNTATVGQTIRVSAVDENGQPTEWEAVDMASGGSGETSGGDDWTFANEITLEEDAASIYFDLETPAKEMLVKCIPVSDDTNKSVTFFKDEKAAYGSNMVTFYSIMGASTSSNRFAVMLRHYPEFVGGTAFYNLYNANVGNNVKQTASEMKMKSDSHFGDAFTCFHMGCWSEGTAGLFQAGTKVEVWIR